MLISTEAILVLNVEIYRRMAPKSSASNECSAVRNATEGMCTSSLLIPTGCQRDSGATTRTHTRGSPVLYEAPLDRSLLPNKQ